MNQRDLEEIPPSACAGIRFEFLTTVDEALEHALEPETEERYRPGSSTVQPSAG
jgi:hypothetical protein